MALFCLFMPVNHLFIQFDNLSLLTKMDIQVDTMFLFIIIILNVINNSVTGCPFVLV